MTDKPDPQQQPRPQRGQLKLEIPAELLAEYANFVLITHSMSEIVLNFAQVLPNMPKVRVQSRVVFTPTNAKLLYKALEESLAKYEDVHGEIRVPPTLADQLFGNLRPTTEDMSGEGMSEDE